MVRFDFGGTLADFVVTSRRLGGLDVLGLASATLTFWSAQSGGTRYTDLLLNGSAVSSISVGADGQVPKFQGPDGVTEMWADGDSPRIRLVTLQGAPGPAGRDGTDGLPGVNAVANDTATAGYVGTAGSATKTALDAVYGTRTGNKPVGRGEAFVSALDYVAPNGTSDNITGLNQGLAAAVAAGVPFVMPPAPGGAYRISAPIAATGGKVVIVGLPGAVIKPLDTYASGDGKDIVHLADTTEAVVDGLTIDGNSTGLNGGAGFPDWTNFIHGINVITQTQAISDASRVTIRNCRISNFPSIGIAVNGHSNVTVESNIVSNGMFHGIQVARTSGAAGSHALIRNNRIVGRGNQGTNPSLGGIGILGLKFDRIQITSNSILNTADTGTKTEGCNDVLFSDNLVVDAGKDGIKAMDNSNTSPGPAVYNIRRAVMRNNTVRRINAWRTDGSSLLLIHNTIQAIITGNLLEGGGTRLADGIRINNAPGVNYPEFGDTIIADNVALDVIDAGIRAITTDGVATRAAARVTLRGNRLTGRIVAGSVGLGDWLIVDNVITKPAGRDAGTALDLQGFGSGSTVVVDRNTISDHGVGVFVTPIASASLPLVRISRNSFRNMQGIIWRVDCFGASTATIETLEVEANTVTDGTAGGTAVNAAGRIGLAQLIVKVAKVTRNVIRNVSTAGGFTYPMEITGTANAIGLLDYAGNIQDSTTSAMNTFIGGLTYGTTVTRSVGYDAATAAPTAGTWLRGDRLKNSTPVEAGTAGSKYVITGWTCVAAGTPGTWLNERVLTGN